MIYEKQGADGKVHRNFVTVDEQGNRVVPPQMKNMYTDDASRSVSRSKSTRRGGKDKRRKVITAETIRIQQEKLSRAHTRILNDLQMSKKHELT